MHVHHLVAAMGLLAQNSHARIELDKLHLGAYLSANVFLLALRS